MPGAIGSALLLDDGAQGWSWLFFFVILAGFTFAGYIAGRLRPDTPLAHGATAAFATFVVAQVFGLVTTVVRDDRISVVAILLAALLALSMGVAGSMISDRVHRRAARTV